MIPRSTLYKLRAQFKTPVQFLQASRLQVFLAACFVTVLVFAGSGDLLAQDVPPPPPDSSQQTQQNNQQLPQYGAPVPEDNGAAPQQQQQEEYPPQQGQAPAPQGQPLSAEQLDQLVAPIALYPDALVAQVLAASTYPTQIVEAEQWLQSQGNAPADQIAAGANAQQWDPSVKALTAFPSVLSQMDRNMQWTTDLGNAYYNQPQDVMDAVQQMRQRAQQSGSLQSTPQQTVSDDNGEVEIQPANPEVVYVPVYNPWVMYGPPVVAFPGYYYPPPPGVFFGIGWGFRIGFGWGIPIRPWAPWGWGWHSWGCGWYNRTVVYNRTTYITRSTTVINRGYNRPGGPPVQLAGQSGSFTNHPGYSGYARNVATGARPAPNGYVNRPGNFNNRPAPASLNNRPAWQPTYNHVQPGYNRPAPANGYMNGNRPAPVSSGFGQRPGYTPAPTYNRPTYNAPPYRPSAPQNYSRPSYSAPAYRPPENYSRPAPRMESAPHYSAPHTESAPHYSAPHGGGGGGGGSHHH